MQMLKQNPFHSMIGLFEIAIGLHLIFNNQYFRWPPMFARIANDDIVGAIFVIVGAGMLYWVYDKQRAARLDHALLIASATCMTVLTFYQLMHFIVLGIDMPWISNAALTGVIMILARRSDSQ
jgi:hypothetical protein